MSTIRLGRDRVGVFVGDKDKTVIKQFINSQVPHLGYRSLLIFNSGGFTTFWLLDMNGCEL
jgi:hypothetical protein